jgi:hypothetical protein
MAAKLTAISALTIYCLASCSTYTMSLPHAVFSTLMSCECGGSSAEDEGDK